MTVRRYKHTSAASCQPSDANNSKKPKQPKMPPATTTTAAASSADGTAGLDRFCECSCGECTKGGELTIRVAAAVAVSKQISQSAEKIGV